MGAGELRYRQSTPRARRYLYRPGLCGREAQIDELLDVALARIHDDTGVAILLSGESGVGKTRLAVELSRELEREGAWALTGICKPLDPPLAGFAAPLRQIGDRCRTHGPTLTARWLGERANVLSSYQPTLAHACDEPIASAPTITPYAARERLFDYLCETLEAVAADQPLVLVLDDLHWSDELTVRALDHMMTSGVFARCRILLFAIYRADDAPLGLDEMARREATIAIEVKRLTQPAIAAMVRHMLGLNEAPSKLVEQLETKTGGNPFFIAEYLRTALAEGLLTRDRDGRWQPTADARRDR